MEHINVLVTIGPKDGVSEATDMVERIENSSARVKVTYRPTRDPAEIQDVIGEADVVFTGNLVPNPANAPRLKWLHVHWAGIDHVLGTPLYEDSDIILTNASGVHSVNMGEYVLGWMLSVAHRFPTILRDNPTEHWNDTRFQRYLPDELRDATLGIVGYGSIGREVARLAKAFGMEVLAVKRSIRHLEDTDSYVISGTGDPQGEIPDRYYPVEALHSFLEVCDYVVLLVPLTSDTYHMIGTEELAVMKPTATLINVARGDVVDEAALIDALRDGEIGGAVLDVYSEEPLPEDSPLWGLENAILTPHVAGFTPHYNERSVDLFIENLSRFIAGEPLLNTVDRQHGY